MSKETIQVIINNNTKSLLTGDYEVLYYINKDTIIDDYFCRLVFYASKNDNNNIIYNYVIQKMKDLNRLEEFKEKYKAFAIEFVTKNVEIKSDDYYYMSFYNIDYTQFCKVNKENVCIAVIDSYVAKYINRTIKYFVIHNIIYIYKNGVYKADEKGNLLKTYIMYCIPEQLRTYNKIRNIYLLCLVMCETKKEYTELNQYNDSIINFADCMYDVTTNKTYNHSVKYYSLNQINYNLSDVLQVGAEIEKDQNNIVDMYLNNAITNADDLKMLLQFCCYCMTKSTEFQKSLILQATGGVGKSVLLELLSKAIGITNISSVSLHDLNENRFASSQLIAKIVNICADISSEAMKKIDTFKKLVGEDTIMCERKCVDGFNYKSYAKLVFSANSIPTNLDGKNNAYYRRLLILKVERTREIKNLKKILFTKNNILYFIYKCLLAGQEMFKNNKIFESDNSKEAVKELEKSTDSVQAFIDDCTIFDTKSFIKKDLLYSIYLRYCEQEERKSLTKNKFYRTLTEEKNISEKTIHGFRYFMNIKIINDYTSQQKVDEIPPFD